MTRSSWMSVAADSWMLGFEASTVIAMRLARMAAGDAQAIEESRRMVAEKIDAAIALQLQAITGGLGRSGPTAAARTVSHYRKAVTRNRKRLAKPPARVKRG